MPDLTLEDVMEWAFEGHHDKNPNATLKIAELLANNRELGPEGAVEWLEAQFPGKSFNPGERRQIILILQGGPSRNVKIHSLQVLEFMDHLFHRGSKIPPPWRE